MEDLMLKGTKLANEINRELGGCDNKINEESAVILKIWKDVDPNNAFELFSMINRIIPNTDKMDKLLNIATKYLIENCPKFYNEIDSNSEAHCYIEVLKEHKLLSLIRKN